jgi:TonB-dependent starch-binding outer membrane protein SusC
MRSRMQGRGRLSLVLVPLAAVLLAVPAAAQQRGRITGKVTEALSRAPLAGAQVFIPNTGLGGLTSENGTYVIDNVPAGLVTVRVSLIGYSSADDHVTVREGQTVQANFELHQTAVALNQIVVTGAGVATERRKLGNTIATVDVSKIMEQSSASDVTQLLQARIPGVSMETTGGLAGEGMRIRIRGDASLTQYNQPIVYVDGVRVDNGGGWGPQENFSGGTGGTADPSRLSDINPDDIERIEVLKGAAAATLYGTEASSGVIQIFTKHGAAGPTRYDVQIEEGLSNYPNHAYQPLSGFVTTDSAAAYESRYWGIPIQPYKAFSVNIVPWLYETGHSQTYSLGVSGGSRLFQYHVSGRMNLINGPFGGSKHFSVPGFQLAQDISNHKQANASLTFSPTDKLRFRVNSMYTEAYQEDPQAGNNIFGTISQIIDSKPETAGCAPGAQIVAPLTCNPPFPANQTGVEAFATTREAMLQRNWQNVQMFEGSVNGNWQITPSLVGDVTFGVQHTAQNDIFFQPFHWNVDAYTSLNVQGDRTADYLFDHRLTFDAHLNWDANIGSSLQSTLVAGSQIFDTQTNSGYEDGNEFPGPGIEVVGAGALQTNFESFLKEVQVGIFGQEQLGWKNFAFLTVGGRFDRHSAFGANAPNVFYPKASISIVPSSLSNWHSTTLSTFRLRAAIGESGRQPGAFDKYTTFSPLAASTGPGLVPNNLGNQNLKPEVTTEIEGGANFGLFNDRIAVDATYWHRTTNDLLYPRQYAPSGGFINAQLSNIGQMKAHGYELSLQGQVLTRKNVALNLYVNGAYLHEVVTSLGGAPPIKVSGSYPRPRNWVKVGYAPGTFFGAVIQPTSAGTYPISVDASCTPATQAQLLQYFAQPVNPSNIHVLVKGGDPGNGPGCATGDFLASYEGKPTPDWTGAFGGTLTVMHNIQLTANFEYKAGNYTLEDLAGSFHNSNPLIGQNTPLAAKTVAILENPASTPQQRVAAGLVWATKLKSLAPLSGLNEMYNGDFIRLREVDLTYNLPVDLAHKFRARSASVTLSGRNLALWTKYPGPDPEMNTYGLQSAGSITNNFGIGVNGWGLPLPHEFTLGIRAAF